MCLIAVAYQAHPRWRLAVIANRDEFHGRPTAPAAPDPEFAEVFGGRDLEQGGSWLLASTRARFSAVTNVRAGTHPEAAPRSRGGLVRGFATGEGSAQDYVAALAPDAAQFGRFNLLCWDGDALHFATNHPRFECRPVDAGVHAMSNGAFDAPWPKSGHATRALQSWLASPASEGDIAEQTLAPLFDALADTTPAPDARLPDTGVGLELERMLSPPFVRGARYGTRCSTVLLVDAHGLTFAEHRFGPEGLPQGTTFAQLPFAATPRLNGETLR
jgi:uncharacterized protein with NRDE domain